MGSLTRLTLAELRQRPGRLLVTSLAVVASAAAVVWVVSGYDALTSKIEEVGEEYHGRYHAWVASPALDEGLLKGLSQDPDVVAADATAQLEVVLEGPKGRAPAGDYRPGDEGYGGEGAYLDGDGSAGPSERPPILVATGAARPPRALVEGAWLDPSSTALHGVLSDGLARKLGATPGTTLRVLLGEESHEVSVVGVVRETQAASISGETVAQSQGASGGGALDATRGIGPAGAALYLPRGALPGQPPPNLAYLALRHGSDRAAFRARWEPKLQASSATLLDVDALAEAMNQSATARATRNQSYAATAVSLLAALFIIFTALSMGVSERRRELAVLRSIGMSRAQVARLVALEALVLASIGWVGGLAAGALLLALAGQSGLAIGPWAILLSGVCAFAGALTAALVPAWSAARVDVVATLAARPVHTTRGWVRGATIAGLVLVGLTPLLLWSGLPLAEKPRSLLIALVGIPGLALGFLLLCPAFVIGVERACGPLLAALFGLPRALLRNQLSANLTRTVGTTAALTVGLGLFITIQVWGRSMLQPFLPGAWAPEALLSLPEAVPRADAEALATRPEVERLAPVFVEQARFAEDLTGVQKKGTSVVRQDNLLLLGAEVEALGGQAPLFHFEFSSDREQALKLLRQGHHVIVPEHFLRATGLSVGDTFELIPPQSPTTTVSYTIAGSITLPGWHFVTKEAALRRRLRRSAALAFTSADDLCRDFSLDPQRVDALALDLAPGVDEAALGRVLEPLAQRANGEPAVMTPAGVSEGLQARTALILWGMSQLPLITLLVTSLGVANAIVASVRARRWEFGVLRAVGVSPSALVRAVLAEALLVGLVASALSLALGLSASWAGVSVAQYVSYFGGLAPPMVVPWGLVLGGVGATLVLCLLAGAWPALMIGRSETLELLQAGRGAR